MNKSNIQEIVDAGRGTVALLIGRGNAGEYFDLSLRGLVGSFIAFLVAATFNAFLPGIMGAQESIENGAMLTPTSAILMVITLFAIQTAFGALALRQFGRLDGLVPYLVADNWASFYITVLSVVLMFFNASAEMSILMVGAIALISKINIARLIVTLKPIQIAMFLIAQLVGILVGLIIVGSLLPEGALGQ